ncbi:MAG: mannose-1-phosphate guanylyltransferase [Thermoanaerobaculia bacterium]
MNVRALLLAGGAGTRLWPLSTERRPKQFLSIGARQSLLRDAFERMSPLGGEMFVATAQAYQDMTRAELPELPAENLLLEPCRRNTGPAIVCAALRFEREGDPITAVVPADQTVARPESFRSSVRAAAETAARERTIVTLGIVPVRPDPEFGYIETEPRAEGGEAFRVRRFVEKPSLQAAEGFLRAGNFSWNAGIFVFRPSDLLSEAGRIAPDLLEACRRYDGRPENERAHAYAGLPSISFDYAIMEKVGRAFCVPCDAGWNDVGSYRALRELVGSDADGNLIVSPPGQPVVAVGVSDSVVAATAEGILVFPISAEGELREVLRKRFAGPR